MNQPSSGGLHLPPILGLSAQEQQQVRSDFDTMDGVNVLLAKHGITPAPKPGFGCPEVTEDDLTTTDNTRYTTTYARLLAWFNYIAPLLAGVTGELLQVENALTYTEAAFRKRARELNTGKRPRAEGWITEAEIADAIILDADYHELHVEKQRLAQMKSSLTAHTERVERSMRVVSRQIEIRKLEIEGNRTEHNMPGRNKFPSIRTPAQP